MQELISNIFWRDVRPCWCWWTKWSKQRNDSILTERNIFNMKLNGFRRKTRLFLILFTSEIYQIVTIVSRAKSQLYCLDLSVIYMYHVHSSFYSSLTREQVNSQKKVPVSVHNKSLGIKQLRWGREAAVSDHSSSEPEPSINREIKLQFTSVRGLLEDKMYV